MNKNHLSEEDRLIHALSQEVEQVGMKLRDYYGKGTPPLSPEQEQRCTKIIQDACQKRRRKNLICQTRRILGRAAVAFLVLLFLSGTVIFSVAALRNSFISLVSPNTQEQTEATDTTEPTVPPETLPIRLPNISEDTPVLSDTDDEGQILDGSPGDSQWIRGPSWKCGNHNFGAVTVARVYQQGDDTCCKLTVVENYVCKNCAWVYQEVAEVSTPEHEPVVFHAVPDGNGQVWYYHCANCQRFLYSIEVRDLAETLLPV